MLDTAQEFGEFGGVEVGLEVEFHRVLLGDGKGAFSRSEDAAADVTFTQTYDTAVALHKGELTIHDAFFAGRIRIAGEGMRTALSSSRTRAPSGRPRKARW